MSFQQALADTIRNVYCTSMEASDNFWSRAGIPGTPIGVPFRPRASLGYRLLCNREPPPLPNNGVNGGQCAIDYVVTVTYTHGFVSANQCVSVTQQPVERPFVRGPITGWQQVDRNGATFFAIKGASTPSTPDGLYLVGGWNTGSTGCPSAITSGSILSVVPMGGLPDNCGDIPPTVPVPPSPNPIYSPTVVYVDNSGNSVNVPIDIRFAVPFVFINGQLNIPFQIAINPEIDFNIAGTINLDTGDVNFDFGGGNGGGGGQPRPPSSYEPGEDPPPDPTSPTNPVDPLPDDGTDERLRSIIRGVIVTTQQEIQTATQIFQSSNPDLFIPRIANVQFAIQIGRTISWTERVNVTSLRQFIPCEWEGGAVDVRGTAEPGYKITLTPVFGKIPDSASYEF